MAATKDIWSDYLSTASYGGIEIDVVATVDTIARSIVSHTYARRDGGDLIDFGAEPRVTECRILFFERSPDKENPSELNHLQRYAAFCAVVARGTPQPFVHPITGQYTALVENFTSEASAEDPNTIDVSCSFVEDTTSPAVYTTRPLDAGVAAVATEALLLDAAAVDAGLSPSGAAISALVDGWDAGTTTVREVNAQMAAITQTVDDAIDEYELATDPSKYYLYRSYQRLHYSARRAAELFKESQPQIYSVTLTADKPLRVLVAENYGALDLEARYSQIVNLNDLDDPTLIKAGTTLRVPARTNSERAGR